MKLKKLHKLLVAISWCLLMLMLFSSYTLAKQTYNNSFEMKAINVGGYKVTYKVINSNAKGVLIVQHGAFMNGDSINNLANRLAKEIPDKTIIIPDFVNHRERTNDAITSINIHANIEKSFIKALKNNRMIRSNTTVGYAGWSMGGSVGLRIAIDESCVKEKNRSIDYLILISSAPVWQSIRTLPQFLPEEFSKLFPNLFRSELSCHLSESQKDLIMKDLSRQTAPPETSIADLEALRKFDVSNELSRVKIPVMIVSGVNDNIALSSTQYYMKNVIGVKNENFHMIANEGHDLVIDNTKYVAGKIKAFINCLEHGERKP